MIDWVHSLWLIVFNATFNQFCGVQFYWWRKPEYPEKTTVDWLYTISWKSYYKMLVKNMH